MPSPRAALAYPFAPRSTSLLIPGQFWAVPLTGHRFACGRVLDANHEGDEYIAASTRTFLAGLLDWCDEEPPQSTTIAGARLLVAQGSAHIKTIPATGGKILGHRPLEADGIRPLQWVTHRGGGTVYLYEGWNRLRSATDDERRSMPLMSTWGFTFIQTLAEKRFPSP